MLTNAFPSVHDSGNFALASYWFPLISWLHAPFQVILKDHLKQLLVHCSLFHAVKQNWSTRAGAILIVMWLPGCVRHVCTAVKRRASPPRQSNGWKQSGMQRISVIRRHMGGCNSKRKRHKCSWIWIWAFGWSIWGCTTTNFAGCAYSMCSWLRPVSRTASDEDKNTSHSSLMFLKPD